MNTLKFFKLLAVAVLALAGLFALLVALPDESHNTVQAQELAPTLPLSAIRYVATSGADVGDCANSAVPCHTVQYAVDVAGEGDVIKVATGVYTDVQSRPVPPGYLSPPPGGLIAQMVYVSKTVTIRGGYATTNWAVPYPITQPTTLDAQGQGRVLVLAGDISSTIEGLRITDGNAAGLGGSWRTPSDSGGGVYVADATVTLGNNWIFNNAAYWGGGGAFFLNSFSMTATIVTTNTAQRGSGLYLAYTDATLTANTIAANGSDYSFGVYVEYSAAVLIANTIANNSGGIHLGHSPATLVANTIANNNNSSGVGMSYSPATLIANIITSNTANYGGGASLYYSDATFVNNVIAGNQGNYEGSGLYIEASSPRLLHNTIARNTGGGGSGVYIRESMSDYSTVMFTNTIVVSQAVGVHVESGSTAVLNGVLWHGNTSNTSGAGTINMTHAITGAPALAADGYHLTGSSATIDAGVDAGVASDIDGEQRPMGLAPDLGADEFPGPALLLGTAGQAIVNIGEPLTYTVIVTASGASSSTNVALTDTLSLQQQPISVVSSRGSCAFGAGWGGIVTCSLGTLNPGESARITLTTQVTATPPGQLPLDVQNSIAVRSDQVVNGIDLDITLHDCHVRLNHSPAEWNTIQAGVDVSTQPTDVVKVAGICGGLNTHGGARQVVYVNKTLTIRGGYATAFTDPPNPEANPTLVDAVGRGRVLYITGDSLGPGQTISPTIEGLRMTGGNAAGMGDPAPSGGGVYVNSAAATFGNNWIFSNTAETGSGLYLINSSATLHGNTVLSNTASSTGGGVHLYNSPAALGGNTISHNTAGEGGGLYVRDSRATLMENTISNNTATEWGGGGGLRLQESPATLISNTIASNFAADQGGGLYLLDSPATLVGNVISNNTGQQAGGGLRLDRSSITLTHNIISGNAANGYPGRGGGIFAVYGSNATWTANTIVSNTADSGGGIYLSYSSPTLTANIIRRNTTDNTGGGGGLYLEESDATLINNVIADNSNDEPYSCGSGLRIYDSSPHLLHTTIANNSGGTGSGVCVSYDSDFDYPHLIDTILAGHTVGIYVGSGDYSACQMNATLWGNDTDWSGPGALYTGTVNVWGDPNFSATGDYHLGPGSAAIDAGVDAGVTSDVDGEPRPMGNGYDIGADEFSGAALQVSKHAVPNPAQAGAQLTYTLYLTNVGSIDLHAAVTDSLPPYVVTGTMPGGTLLLPGGIITWTGITLAPGGVWSQTVVVTVAADYVGTLSNVVQASSAEGASGVYTETTLVLGTPPGAPVLLAPQDGIITTTQAITLAWQAGAGGAPAGYHVMVDGAAVTTTQTSSATLLALGDHTWTARAFNAAGLSAWAEARTIHITGSGACIPITGVTFAPTWTASLSPTTLIPMVTPGNASQPITYTWDFGDGSPPVDSPRPTHAFECDALVTLTATNECSQRVFSHTVEVALPPCCVPPQAGFTYTLPALVGTPITFTNTTTGCMYPTIVFTWNFGDNTPPAVAVHPLHVYTATGDYTVWLTASMDCGCGQRAEGFYSDTLTVSPHRLYLPLIVKNG